MGREISCPPQGADEPQTQTRLRGASAASEGEASPLDALLGCPFRLVSSH